MKKWTVLLAVVLCMALSVCSALAEETPWYQIGEQLFLDAWNSGKLIKADTKLQLELNPEALGLTDDASIAQIEAMQTLLDALTLSYGAVRLDDGIRIQLEGTLEFENSTPTSVDAAVELTYDGVSVECSLLPGEKVSAKWETLLAMAGFSQDEIEMLLSLRDTDVDSLLEQLQQGLVIFAALTDPYVDTVATWMAGLHCEQTKDLAADDTYPATALRLDFYITQKDVGDLIVAIAEQLRQDENLLPIVDEALAKYFIEMYDAETTSQITLPTAQDLCDMLVEEAASLTGTDPLTLTLGFDEANNPLYGELFVSDTSGESVYFGLFLYPDAETGATQYEFTMFIADANNNIEEAISFSGSYFADPQDPLTSSFTLDFIFASYDDLNVALNCKVDSVSTTTEDGLPAATVGGTMTLSVQDDLLLQAVMSYDTQYAQTADGGLSTDVTTKMDMYVDDQALNYTTLGSALIVPTEDGFSFIESVLETAPSIGLDRYGLDITASAEEYVAPEGLKETALETVSTDEMDALALRLQLNATGLLVQLQNTVPEEIQALFTDTSEEVVPEQSNIAN